MSIIVDLQKKALSAWNKLAALERAPDMAWSGLKAEMDMTTGDLLKGLLRNFWIFRIMAGNSL
jgi:hypothetical protein